MKTIAILLGLVAVAVCGPRPQGDHKGHHHHHGMMMNMTCKGQAMNMTSMFKGGMECMKELFPGVTPSPPGTNRTFDKETMKQFKDMHTCVEVCKWKKQGILKEDGSFDAQGTTTLIKSVFPTNVQTDLTKAFQDCADKSSSELLNKDEKCQGHAKFGKCTFMKVAEICEFKMMKKHGKKSGQDKDDESQEE